MRTSAIARRGQLGLLAASALAALCGCSAASGSTTGKRIALHTSLAESLSASTFTTGFGWDVTLTRAALATSGFYYFDGPPPTALFKLRKRSVGRRIADWAIGSAWAHPGHYQAGTALGEMLLPEPVVLNLLADAAVALPDGEGVTGVYRSARFLIASAPPDDRTLDGHVAIAEGSAVAHESSADTPTYFRLVADYADVAMSVTQGAVDGCVLEEAQVTEDGTITVRINPAIWLNLVDFSKIDPGTEQSPTEAYDVGFSQGVTQLSAYHFAYSKTANDER